MRPAILFGTFQIINFCVVKCLEKRCREIIEPKLNDTQSGFRLGRSTVDQIFTLQKTFEKSLKYAKNVYTCFVDLQKAYVRVPCEKLWECCGSTVLTAACYCAASRCIPAQKFVSVSGELNLDGSPLVLDSDKGACCHHSSS